MMYGKAILFGDDKMAANILNAPTARKAKELGRKVRNFNEKLWGERSISIVADGCNLKFSQCEEARNVLMATLNKILCEKSPRDRIWGIGMVPILFFVCHPFSK